MATKSSPTRAMTRERMRARARTYGTSSKRRASQQKPRVQSAARTVGILLAIAGSRDGLKVKEIGESLHLPRQVTYHLLHTLSGTGIVRRNDQNRYVLGLSAAKIVDGFRRQLAPPDHLAPRVRAVAAKSGETAYASGWIEDEIVVLATNRGHSAVHVAEVPHGYSEDAHARASGKLLLALAEPSVRDAYLDHHKPSARTKKTITSRKHLAAEFERIRARGYAIDDEEFVLGVCCLAVPVESLGGEFVLAMSIPAERFHKELDRYLTLLRRAARMDSTNL